MGRLLDFSAMTSKRRMKKRSKAGRPKTKFFQLKLVTGGLDTWVQLEPARVAALVGVSVQTVYHWINGTKTPAPTTLALLEIVAGGLLPWRGWHGWRLSPETGRLIAPNGYSFQPGELAWWSLQKQLIRELERDNAGLRLQLEILRAQVNEQAANNLLPFTKAKKYRG